MPGKQGTTRERLPSALLRAPSTEQTHLGAAPAAVARRAHSVAPGPSSSVQFDFARISIDKNVTDVARQGLAGSGTALPHLSTLQPLFGGHDLSGIQAVIGGRAAEASRSLGATAYAQGERVGFVGAPDLFATAHEAAHVVQQRSGRVGVGYHGRPGDEFERQADSVADLVVRGQSAASVLNQNARGESTSRSPGSAGSSVQFKLAAGQDLEDIPEDDRIVTKCYFVNTVLEPPEPVRAHGCESSEQRDELSILLWEVTQHCERPDSKAKRTQQPL